MTVSAGLGIANFPFEDHRGFWRWVDLCDTGGVDSIWQSDRIISTDPQLEALSVMAALAGGSKRLKFGMNVTGQEHKRQTDAANQLPQTHKHLLIVPGLLNELVSGRIPIHS